MADPAAVPGQPVRGRSPLLARQEHGNIALDLGGVGVSRPAKPPCQPGKMGVYREGRRAEGIPEDHIGCLAADPRKRHELSQRAGYLAAEAVAQRLPQADEGVRLSPEIPGRMDHRLQLGPVRGRVVCGGAVPGEQQPCHLVGAPVSGLRGQDRRHQQFERGGEIQLYMGIGVQPGQLTVDPARSADQRGLRRRSLGHLASLTRNHRPARQVGNYVLGSAYGYRPLAAALATAAGRGVLVPDFRLAPEHPFPAALDDALAAYRWLAAQRGAASEVVLAGDSSGAGLALAVLLSLKAEGEAMPAGAALLCPNLDLSGAMLTPSAGPHLLDELVRMCQAYIAGHPLEDPRVSPLLGDLTGLPPLLIQYASGDRARPEAEALVRDARYAGVDVRVERYAADTHVFQPSTVAAADRNGGRLVSCARRGEGRPSSPRQ